jgi:molybdopterin-guanine dinucleotide biosynthesis protein A
MRDAPAYILAGGRSRRFGADKALASVGGEPLLAHIARTLEPAASRVTVVADRVDKYVHLGLRTVADVEPGCGPLGGLQRAWLDARGAKRILVSACDFVGARTAWFNGLALACRSRDGVVLFDTAPLQPLLACFGVASRPTVESMLRTGVRSMHALLDRCDVRLIPPPPDWIDLRNVNRAEDLAEAACAAGGCPR